MKVVLLNAYININNGIKKGEEKEVREALDKKIADVTLRVSESTIRRIEEAGTRYSCNVRYKTREKYQDTLISEFERKYNSVKNKFPEICEWIEREYPKGVRYQENFSVGNVLYPIIWM